MLLYLLIALLCAIIVFLFERNRKLESLARSLRVKRGMNVEQMLPLSESYPYDARGFRFIGSPVDGIQFTDDAVVLVEFKSGKSRLSPAQRKIKSLVDKGKVRFEVYRVE